MFEYIILLAIIILGYKLYQYFYLTPNIDPNGKYVLISSCDTGFGHGLAIELDNQGFNVFAGIYDPKNQESLTQHLSSRATVFKLDITRQDDIDAAYEMISTKTKTLHALVNNAGIANGGLIDWITVESMRKLMDVNFFGHVAMTKKFLPLLITKIDSRVVNLCSVAGYIAPAGMSSYCATKYALEAFSDCLRREMAVWGLHVNIIEPGSMKTPLTDNILNSINETWNQLPDDVRERWGNDFYKSSVQRFVTQGLMDRAENPQKVINALKHAVMNTAPRIRYRPGFQSPIVFPLSLAPAWLADRIMALTTNPSILPAGVQKRRQT